jgi:hypothetical protein
MLLTSHIDVSLNRTSGEPLRNLRLTGRVQGVCQDRAAFTHLPFHVPRPLPPPVTPHSPAWLSCQVLAVLVTKMSTRLFLVPGRGCFKQLLPRSRGFLVTSQCCKFDSLRKTSLDEKINVIFFGLHHRPNLLFGY